MKNNRETSVAEWWLNIRYSIYEFFRKLGKPFERKKSSKFALTNKVSSWMFAYLILLLPVLYFLIFYVYVNFNGVLLAFKDVATGAFTFENFAYVIDSVLKGGGQMYIAIKNTFVFWGVSWILMPINIIVSFILYKKVMGYKIFQTIFYLPTIIGGVVWMTAYKNFISPSGPLCDILVKLGAFSAEEIPEFLFNSDYALQAVVWSSIWMGIPGGMLVYCGSLSRIPSSVIEAAKLDGTGFWREIWSITLPLLGPLIATNVLFTIIGMLGSSGNILLLTEGRHGTTTLNYWFYEQIVVGGNYNVPSAMGLLMTLITLPFVIVGKILTNKIQDIEY